MVLYQPGEEPEKIKKKLNAFFARIDAVYPDKTVIGLHQAHKHLGERATALYRMLGYASAQEMMEAYGYIYVLRVRAASKTVQARKADAASHVLRELTKRYPEGGTCVTVHMLMRENPDLRTAMRDIPALRTFLTEHGFLVTPQQRTEMLTEQIRAAFVQNQLQPIVCGNLSDFRRSLPPYLHDLDPILDELQILLRKQQIPMLAYLAKQGFVKKCGMHNS